MNQQRFANLVLDYAAIQRRKGRSYASQVESLLHLRAKSIVLETNNPDMREAALDLAREYVRVRYDKPLGETVAEADVQLPLD
jgi:hypothetical protein